MIPLDEPQTAAIARVIELAVAPVFLLTGIAALLGVMANRIARIVDRARILERQLSDAPPTQVTALRVGLRRLASRARVCNVGVSLITLGAVLVATVVMLLFVGALSGHNLVPIIAGLFIAAMSCLIAGLLCFLREIYLATRYVRIGEPEPGQAAHPPS